jgi:hypothetical protein
LLNKQRKDKAASNFHPLNRSFEHWVWHALFPCWEDSKVRFLEWKWFGALIFLSASIFIPQKSTQSLNFKMTFESSHKYKVIQFCSWEAKHNGCEIDSFLLFSFFFLFLFFLFFALLSWQGLFFKVPIMTVVYLQFVNWYFHISQWSRIAWI